MIYIIRNIFVSYGRDIIFNGIRIIDERKNIIFERRDEQGKSTGGMGIGLSIVKKNPSEGSNFIILLPKE